MKIVLSFVAVAIFFTAQTAAEPNGKCPSEMNPERVDFLTHRTDCSKFYKCDWGKAVEYDCPDGLHFNPTLDVCDWPEQAGCGGGGSGSGEGSDSDSDSSSGSEESNTSAPPPPPPPPTTTPAPATTEKDSDESDSSNSSDSSESSESSDSNSSGDDSGSVSGDNCDNSKCPAVNGEFPEYFAFPGDCGKFCQCDWGVAYKMDCPDGLEFNTKLNVCDWSKDAGCTAED